MCLDFGCRFAYIEFVEKDGVESSVKLNESLFKGRQLKVLYQPATPSFVVWCCLAVRTANGPHNASPYTYVLRLSGCVTFRNTELS